MRRFHFVVLCDIEGGGAGAGSGAGTGAAPSSSGTPASPAASPGSAGTPSGTPAPSPASTPAAAAAPVPASSPNPNEFIPRHRYNETATRLREAEAMVTRYRSMLEAGTGAKVPGMPDAPQDPRVVEARNFILEQLVPELKPLLSLKPEQLQKMLQAAEQFPQFATRYASSEEAHWAGRGEQALDYLATNVAKDLGVDKLTPFQQLNVGNTFIAWMGMDQGRVSRYGRGDSRVFDEFLTEYRSGLFEPMRRIGQTPGAEAAARNAGLPPATRRSSMVPAGSGPAAPKSEDDVHDAAWKNFAAANGR